MCPSFLRCGFCQYFWCFCLSFSLICRYFDWQDSESQKSWAMILNVGFVVAMNHLPGNLLSCEHDVESIFKSWHQQRVWYSYVFNKAVQRGWSRLLSFKCTPLISPPSGVHTVTFCAAQHASQYYVHQQTILRVESISISPNLLTLILATTLMECWFHLHQLYRNDMISIKILAKNLICL